MKLGNLPMCKVIRNHSQRKCGLGQWVCSEICSISWDGLPKRLYGRTKKWKFVRA